MIPQSRMHYGHPHPLPTEEKEEEEDNEDDDEDEDEEEKEAPLLSSLDSLNSKRKQARAPKSPYKVHK